MTDSGRTEAAVKPASGGDGDGDALGVGDGAVASGDAVACGVVGGLLHPASSNAATTPPSREASITTVKRGISGHVSIRQASNSGAALLPTPEVTIDQVAPTATTP